MYPVACLEILHVRADRFDKASASNVYRARAVVCRECVTIIQLVGIGWYERSVTNVHENFIGLWSGGFDNIQGIRRLY